MKVEQIGEYLEHKGLSDDEIDEFLAHFGVKGQKWGVRRKRPARVPSKSERQLDLYNSVKKNNKLSRRIFVGSTAIVTYGLAKSLKMSNPQRVAMTAATTALANSTMKVIGNQTLAEFKA